MSDIDKALSTLRHLRESPLMSNHHAGLDAAIAALAAPAPQPAAAPMTASRAQFFMERFKREEKLLGPNEQAALDFVIAMLESPAPSAAPRNDDLRTAATRVITAFESLGVSRSVIDDITRRRDCEAAMLALKAALKGPV